MFQFIGNTFPFQALVPRAIPFPMGPSSRHREHYPAIGVPAEYPTVPDGFSQVARMILLKRAEGGAGIGFPANLPGK